MLLSRRRLLSVLASTAALPALAHRAPAQSYPSRPIRLIVPFPPGGAFDTIGRPWADRMKNLLGTVMIENIGGSGGAVGAAQAARSRPDGYTLLLGGATTHVTEALLKNRPQYDPVKDLMPISAVAITAFALAVHPSVPAKSVRELVALAKKTPDKLNYGSSGIGGNNHFSGALFASAAGVKMTHIPYTGIAPAVTALARTLSRPNSTTATKLFPLVPYQRFVFGYRRAP